jgi:AraC family transcriptional regulator
MPVVERARTALVVVHSFSHAPTDARASCEWWPRSCVAFTTFGSWEIRSSGGRGAVNTDSVIVGHGGKEYDCRHDVGVDDRALVVTYRREVEPSTGLVLPLGSRLHVLRRSLVRELRCDEPDATAIDELCVDLLTLTRSAMDRLRRPTAATRSAISQVRAQADARFTDPSLDLVAEAAATGMSRTRFVHCFREVVGVTPHQYVVELRTAHAARLLIQSRAPIAEVCFDSGFGSIARFNAAFRAVFGVTPTAYRASLAAPVKGQDEVLSGGLESSW